MSNLYVASAGEGRELPTRGSLRGLEKTLPARTPTKQIIFRNVTNSCKIFVRKSEEKMSLGTHMRMRG